MDKKGLMADYNTTAGIYDLRYGEEQALKISFILSRIAVKEGSTVVDVGCGTGFLLEKLEKKASMQGQLVGVDISINMLRGAKRKLTRADVVLADAEAVPFRDCCFDAVFSVSVMQLVPEPQKSIAELLRLLKEGGSFGASILRKSKSAHEIGNVAGLTWEIYDSETMKDVFLIGKK